MNEQPLPTKAAFFAYFAHHATPLERQLIENCLHTVQGTKAYFFYLDEWERQHPQFHPDLDSAHDRYEQYRLATPPLTSRQPIVSEPAQPVQEPPPYPWHRLGRLSGGWSAVAASVLLLLSLWLSADWWYYKTLTNDYQQIRTVTLPDGSAVVLGAHSSLRYARYGFGVGTRRVLLTGEAQFKVTHPPDSKLFSVQTPNGTQVEVLGTVFVVNSRRNKTRVMLQTGRVRMNIPKVAQPVLLVPGDVVTVSAQGHLQKQRQTSLPAQVTWQNHQFFFQDTPLAEVANQLHDTFGITIIIPQTELMNRTVTGTFQADKADDLLEALTRMMQLRVEKSKTTYKLYQ
ncbi:hypothetical protein GCM10027275_55140 [Rhabdobacter roseus]|uniref:Ferric-dicitrate binding protein FerR (Iron transport regulator) n=1 Tax=Rhabdobacter roseus TaxID=1655419 RepID=A0A840U6T5_9BACT|nr:FecR domain-containing protein [Rhabdobacter roseus]MBB5287529.1 ferric-dicitrate binding protein FerR (iron transport regulator) [Rhabdobacter roseus]